MTPPRSFDPGSIPDQRLVELYNYWRDKAGGRAVRRAPTSIPST